MKKYCDGVGLFDTDDATVYVLSRGAFAGEDSVMYELQDGTVWILQSTNFDESLRLEKVNLIDAAKAFTVNEISIPDILAKQLSNE